MDCACRTQLSSTTCQPMWSSPSRSPLSLGNIRELQNFIERSVILTDGNTLRPPLKGLQQTAEFDSLKPITLEEAERRHIRKTLEQANWVVAGPSGAAVRLGMKRSTVYFRMRKLGIFRA
jgi:formate hydrogenlyase transcriptional activator